MVLALVGGTFLGAYLMWEFFPDQPVLQVCACTPFLLITMRCLVSAPGRVQCFLQNSQRSSCWPALTPAVCDRSLADACCTGF